LTRQFLATLLGQRELATAFGSLGLDEALVFEQLQSRVQRSGARTPYALGSISQFLHHLVTVHRTFGEQR
jgi:hypothetical protein